MSVTPLRPVEADPLRRALGVCREFVANELTWRRRADQPDLAAEAEEALRVIDDALALPEGIRMLDAMKFYGKYARVTAFA